MKQYMESLGESGEVLLQLTELGLDVPEGSLTRLTRDGWHHLRILRQVARYYHSNDLITNTLPRFPATHATNGKGKDGRGIGSHTDYGLLVLAAADDVGGK